MYLALRVLRALFAVGGAAPAPRHKSKPDPPIEQFKRGDRVIVVDNEDSQYFVATVMGYKEVGRMGSTLPVIKDDDGVVYVSMSILRPYSENLVKELDLLNPIEQWNYLAHDHSQIKRDGLKQFKCKCNECTSRRKLTTTSDE